MRILGIETSCDETAASVIEKSENLNIVTNVVSSSIDFHAKTGGIIPEVAAREQTKLIIPVIEEALKEVKDIDAIAVTNGPGLNGSLLIGVETAKTLSFALNKPLIPVNHLLGHVYANWIDRIEVPQFPAIALIVSGGHTDLVYIRDHEKIKWLGGTKDDAVGEAFDKIGRLLGFPYPGGPEIEKAANKYKGPDLNFPRPMIGSNDFDFSFSGLKTAVLRETLQGFVNRENEIAFSVQKAVVDVLVSKTLKAIKKYKVKSLILGGGVAANQKLRDELELKSPVQLFIPRKNLCTDNGAMIAAAAFYNKKVVSWKKIKVDPSLHF